MVVWLLGSAIGLDTQSAVGVGTVAVSLILTPLAWFASKNGQLAREPGPVELPAPETTASGEPSTVPPRLVVGDIPLEAVAWQERTQLLDRLMTVSGSGRPTVVCAVTGQRGIGKTQIAAAYARRRIADGWPVVVWILADTELGLMTGLDQLAAAAGVRQPTADLRTSATTALAWLRVQPGPCLLVYDNALDPDLIRRFTPSVGAVHTLVTTTELHFGNIGVTIDVDVFTDSEAVAYLRERTGLADDNGARETAERLGRLPVALSQLGSVVGPRRRFPSFRAYLDLLDRLPAAELLPRVAGDPYPRGAAEAILISLDDLSAVDPDGAARRLLNQLAVLAPGGVDAVLLDNLVGPADGGRHDAATTAAILAHRSLTMPMLDHERTVAHRLIQRVVRDRARQAGDLDMAITTAAAAVRNAAERAGRRWSDRALLTEYTEHLQALFENSTGDAARGEILTLLARVSFLLNETHSYSSLIAVGPVVLAQFEKVLGRQHTDTLVWLNNLAHAYQEMGRLDEAMEAHLRALADRERLLGPDHPHTLTSRNNVAHVYQRMGRLDEALELHTRTLADRERLLGPDHPHTLTSRNNVAHVYQRMGRLDEAIELHTRTLADRERVLGSDDPDTLVSRNDLAVAYRWAGRVDEAIELHERTLADRERVLGPDHIDTLVSRNDLAVAYRSAGRVDEAIELHGRTLADRQRVLGSQHPDTVTSRNNLAEASRPAGDLNRDGEQPA
ncbi:FxSxx-COOH system tetratricopeptide repeat protein [Actinoplanes sp. NPDC024001]|uniref:FxSxx-COOH system tetratricopeptide repeat protein n=1 Tax=Actinoplanes sp. NPDC024001 TaxID=3154598 RepID=UPI0033FDB40B